MFSHKDLIFSVQVFSFFYLIHPDDDTNLVKFKLRQKKMLFKVEVRKSAANGCVIASASWTFDTSPY